MVCRTAGSRNKGQGAKAEEMQKLQQNLFFSLCILELTKYQCACTPSEIRSTGLFLKMLLRGWEAREKNHGSRGMHTVQ